MAALAVAVRASKGGENMLAAVIWFVWTFIVFGAGMLTHWLMTRKQRRLLKLYRQQAKVMKEWGRPVE